MILCDSQAVEVLAVTIMKTLQQCSTSDLLPRVSIALLRIIFFAPIINPHIGRCEKDYTTVVDNAVPVCTHAQPVLQPFFHVCSC